MYAVVKTGGKQYRVAPDDVITVERLAGEAGDIITLDEVLMIADGDKVEVGAPMIDGASVAAELVEQARGKKIIIFKKKRRKHYRRKNGHRQDLTMLRVTEILTGGKKPSKAAAKKAAPAAEAKADDAKVAKAKADDSAAAKKAPAKKAAAPGKLSDDDRAQKIAAAAAGGALFTAPSGKADDLKEISGVGPVLEKKLNELGVTKFAQIAAFTEDDILMVDEVLSFKGRIERDEWLSQAAALAAGGDKS